MNFTEKTYNKWIIKNLKRFKYTPANIESGNNGISLSFSGITDQIICTIDKKGSLIIYVNDSNGKYWDALLDYELSEEKTEDGMFYCKSCKSPKYYHSRTLLWEDHIFEELLKWINDLNSFSRICCYGVREEEMWGAILFKNINEQKKQYESYKVNKKNKCFPVVTKNRH